MFFCMDDAKECADGECICSEFFGHFSDDKSHSFECIMSGPLNTSQMIK